MSSEHKNSTNESSPQLSEQEIKNYHSGNLSSVEMHRIERIAENNPLSKAALEGLSGGDFSESISGVRKTVAFRTGLRFGFFQKSVLLVSVAALIALIAVWMNNNEDKSQMLIGEELSEKKEHLDEVETRINTPNSEIESNEKLIVKSERTDSSVSLTFSSKMKEIENSEENYVSYLVVDSMLIVDGIKPDPIPEKEDALLDENKPLKQTNRGSSQAIYHIEDYKVVDYRNLREEEFTQLKTELGGTPAKYANQDEKVNDLAEPTFVQVAYVDYLDEAILLFSRNNYKEASRKFKTILRKYPDDANALFYKGICDFRMGNYKKASKVLSESLEGEIKTFHQESEYYMAKSLFRSGKVEESKVVLNSIVEKGGFYNEQAKDFLNEIKD